MRFDRLVLIFTLLVLPVAIWPGSTSYDGAKFTLLAAAGACWLGSLAWRLVKGRPVSLPSTGFLIAGIALLAVLTVSAGRAHNTGLVLRTVILTALWLAVVGQVAIATTDTRRMHTLLACAVTSGVAVCLYGLAQIAGIVPGAPASSGFPPGISTLGNQNYLSGLAAVLLWPSVILWSAKSRLWRGAAVGATTILTGTVVAAGATGPLAALVGSFFLVAPSLVLARRGAFRHVPIVLGSSLLLTVTVGGFLFSEAMRSPPTTLEEEARASLHRKLFLSNHGALRRANWLVARDMFMTSPVTGRGAGNYAALWPVTRAKLYADPSVKGLEGHEPLAVRAHNEAFQFLGETGLLGGLWLAFFGAAAVWGWRRRWVASTGTSARPDFLCLTAAWVVAILHAMVSFPLHLPATALALALVTGLLFSPVFGDQKKTRRSWTGHRILAVLPGVCALLLLGSALREYAGDLHLGAGQKAFAAGRHEEALSHLEKSVELRRWPGLGYLYLGLVRGEVGNPDGMRSALETSLGESPTFEGYLALAELCIDQGKFPEADDHLTLVEGCEPVMAFRVQTTYLRGLAELRQGNQETAGDRFRELLQIDPDNQRAWLALGYQEMLGQNHSQARIYYSRALEAIDRKLGLPEGDRLLELKGSTPRLKKYREVALKALESVP